MSQVSPVAADVQPDLSLVIPVWNGASFVRERFSALTEFLETTRLSYEVIPVDDGSLDETAEALRTLGLRHFVPLTGNPHRGKWGALRAGMQRTQGRVCIFTDADIPYDLAAIPYLVHLIRDLDFHLAVGDRTLAGSSYAETLGTARRFATQAFAFAIRMLLTGGLFDTQCGLKAFRGDVARAMFPLVQEDGFGGDVEILYIALKYNLAIRRVPVRLRHHGPSSVSTVKDGLLMLRSILPLKSRFTRGDYRSDALEAIAAQEYGSLAQDVGKALVR